MKLESLPNEIILTLFEYFSLVELFQYFCDLNSRFNHLLCGEFHKFQLDLKSLSKTEFVHLCQTYVPSILNRIISIHLSNDHPTPQGIQLFLSQNYQLRQFTHLQALLISNLQSKQTLDEILKECSHLPHLRHLTIGGTVEMTGTDKQHVFNQIWGLSKLQSIRFNINCSTEKVCNSAVISKSLKYVNMKENAYSLATFADLYQKTPDLQHFSGSFSVQYNESQILKPCYSITRLNITFDGLGNMLEQVLENLPNLYRFKCDLNVYINGYQWENIIRKSLSKLKIFQVKMRFPPSNNLDKEEQLNEIIDSYRTNFWVKERQWFVRCHWYALGGRGGVDSFIDLFTVPYSFDTFWDDNICLFAKSTVPYNDEYLHCPRVTTLRYQSASFTDPIRSRCRFDNVEHLSLSFPFDEHLFLVVSKLDRLKSLFIYADTDKNFNNIQSQLQRILDQAPRLSSLTFTDWSQSRYEPPLVGLHSASVHQLDLMRLSLDDEDYEFDENKCLALIRSPLGAQCETLAITVESKRDILTLIYNMPNVRSLYVHCLDCCRSRSGSISSVTDELVQWLRQQLPSTCAITKDEKDSFGIHLWIR